jgi:leucyl-tRNA synthetase
MWSALGSEHAGLVAHAEWPDFDPALAEEPTATVVVQVNGRLRARLELAEPDDERAAREAALAHPAVRPWVEGREVARTVFVPGKLLNLVVE